MLLLAGGAGTAGDRVQHAVPTREVRGGLLARPGPGARRRRPRARVLTAMTSIFALPDVGEGLTEAEILSWHVTPGDTVTVNQIIVDIETAKAAVELPSPYAGWSASCSSNLVPPSPAAPP